MDEARLYISLQPYIVASKQYQDNGFPLPLHHPYGHLGHYGHQSVYQCYRCGSHYSGLDGTCFSHAGTFVVIVPTNLVRLVMGKKGMMVKKISEESGAKLVINPNQNVAETELNDESIQEVEISGSPDQISLAENAVLGVVATARNIQPGYWKCCRGTSRAVPCVYYTGHVRKDNFQDRNLIVSAPAQARPGKVFALDCEMVRTARGSELAGITVVDFMGNVCYDTLVRPPVPVGDYRTEYSGITESMLENVSTYLVHVQATVGGIIAPQDIILGHSLHSDLQVLHLHHRMVVDTGLVYLHPENGRRISLKKLALEYLGRNIQEGRHGHDSREDALAVLDLMKKKVWRCG